MKAYTPTIASGMTGSSVAGGFAGGTEPALAATKPLPLGAHPPQVNVRSAGQPINKFQSPAALPHMIHPQNMIGLPGGKR
jgi:hypothetical protein